MAVRLGWAGLAACLLCSPAWADEGCSKPVTTSTGDWAPYNYVDEQGRYTGMDTELSRAILLEAGCTLVELNRMPPLRNTYMFSAGKVDMMAGASRTLERSKTAFFSVAYRSETVRLFATPEVARQYSHLKSFDDVLRDKVTLLAPRVGWYGHAYQDHMSELRADKRLSLFNEPGDGISMIAAGRGMFLLGEQAGVVHAAAKRGVKLVPLPFWLVDAPVHLMFNKQTMTESDVRRVDAAIERLRRKGVLERIRRSYGGPWTDS